MSTHKQLDIIKESLIELSKTVLDANSLVKSSYAASQTIKISDHEMQDKLFLSDDSSLASMEATGFKDRVNAASKQLCSTFAEINSTHAKDSVILRHIKDPLLALIEKASTSNQKLLTFCQNKGWLDFYCNPTFSTTAKDLFGILEELSKQSKQIKKAFQATLAVLTKQLHLNKPIKKFTLDLEARVHPVSAEILAAKREISKSIEHCRRFQNKLHDSFASQRLAICDDASKKFKDTLLTNLAKAQSHLIAAQHPVEAPKAKTIRQSSFMQRILTWPIIGGVIKFFSQFKKANSPKVAVTQATEVQSVLKPDTQSSAQSIQTDIKIPVPQQQPIATAQPIHVAENIIAASPIIPAPRPRSDSDSSLDSLPSVEGELDASNESIAETNYDSDASDHNFGARSYSAPGSTPLPISKRTMEAIASFSPLLSPHAPALSRQNMQQAAKDRRNSALVGVKQKIQVGQTTILNADQLRRAAKAGSALPMQSTLFYAKSDSQQAQQLQSPKKSVQFAKDQQQFTYDSEQPVRRAVAA